MPKTFWNFSINFQKIRVFNQHETYAIILNDLQPVQQQNLVKIVGALFWKFCKCPRGLM